MTSKVALQVGRLASFIDKQVGTKSADQNSVPAVNNTTNNNNNINVTDSSKQQLSPLEPIASSSSSSTSSGSSSSLSSLASSSSSPSSSAAATATASINQLSSLVGSVDNKKNLTPQYCVHAKGCSIKSPSKRRKMGNDLDSLNDSGVPMEVELDSSTVARSGNSPHQIAGSTTTTTNPTSSATNNLFNSRTNSTNEAVASFNLASALSDEPKGTENYSPDYCPPVIERHVNTGMDDIFHNSSQQSQQQQSGQQHQSQNHHQTSSGLIRSFGDLFDDDDLD